jgi:uncharacterized protein
MSAPLQPCCAQGNAIGAKAMIWILLGLAGVWAGLQNAVAGGGSFITLPALIFTGLDARIANITSTIALSVGQMTTGWGGRKAVQGVPGLPVWAMLAIAISGGLVGAKLILITPSALFAAMVPWLILAATALFAWGSFGPKPAEPRAPIAPLLSGAGLFFSSIYGGYFGGGNGIILVTVLSAAGLAIRAASATKNVMAAIINVAAMLLFIFSPDVAWMKAIVLGAGAIIGGALGNVVLARINERLLRVTIVLIGIILSVLLFLR